MSSAATTRKHREREGKCSVCLTRKASPGHKTCPPCRKAAAAYSTKRYEEQRAARRCARSGCPNPATGWLCDEHKELRRQRCSGQLPSSPSPGAKRASTVAAKTSTARAVKPAVTPVAAAKPGDAPAAEPAVTPVAKPGDALVAKPAVPSNIGIANATEMPAGEPASQASVLQRRPAGSDRARDPLTIAHQVMSQAQRRDSVMPPDEDLDRLARAYVASARPLPRQLYISLTAAKQFAASHGFADVEAARRRLQVLLDSAHPTAKHLDVWRARHANGVDISVRVDRDDSGTDLLVVVGIINVRGLDRAPARRHGHRADW